MQKIINGKMYDTDTAFALAHWDNKYPEDNLDYCCEELYQKRTGEFFIFGTGGPRSKYSKMLPGNKWCGISAIRPITLEDAMKWVEDFDREKYEKIFGKVKKNDTKKVVSFSLKTSTTEIVSRLARERGCTRSEIIDMLVEAEAVSIKAPK